MKPLPQPATQPAGQLPRLWLVLLSFAIIYIVWGLTYLANWWAVRSIPPFFLAGIRFFAAGLIMYFVGMGLKQGEVTKRQLRNTFFSGLMLFSLGNGMLVWALQFMDSGIASLVVAFEPLLVVFLQWIWRGRRPAWDTLLGVGLGISGMLLLVGQPRFASDPQWMMGLGGIIFAMFGWAYISVWLPKADMPKSHFQSASLQMLFGGAILLLVSIFSGEMQDFDLSRITDKAIWSLVFLIIFGSIIAFTAFNYLLKNVPPEKAVTNAYVNPVIALFLGWWLNKEVLSVQSLTASVFLLAGVVLIVSRISTRNTR